MKLFLIFNFSLLIFNYSFAQPAIQWQKCLGGTNFEIALSVQQTADGGYIIAGEADSNDGDVTGNHGSNDYWIVKLDSSGNLQWQKCFGGTADDYATSIQQTADGGYIVAGATRSNDGDVTGNHDTTGIYSDYWLVKLDNSGNIQWQKCLGGTGADAAASVQQTGDGGYIVAGSTHSNDGDVSGNHGSSDYWIVKLDYSGNLQWQKCLGGTNNDDASSVEQTTDGGYIVAGYTISNDGDVTGNHNPTGFTFDYWIIKLNGSGNIQWQKCLGGTSDDVAFSSQQTVDEGYIVAGWTESNNGDVTGNHGQRDYWVIKSDSSGTLQWQKCLGGTGVDLVNSVKQTIDGGYIVAGSTESNDGDVTGNHDTTGSYFEYWIIKQDGNGNIQWKECLGGTGSDGAHSVRQTDDGGYIVAGFTQSNDGNVTGNHGNYDYWVVKLSSPVGLEEESNNAAYNIYPNPFTLNAVINFSNPVHNATFSLYNLLGEKVAEATDINGESFQFNRGNLPSGVYIFEVREKGKSIGRGKAVVY